MQNSGIKARKAIVKSIRFYALKDIASFYIFDRAYMATEKLYIIEGTKAYFVVREKHKMSFEIIEDKEYNNPLSGIMADQIIRFKGHKIKKQYPNQL